MKIKKIELKDFKRFTHLTIEDIPQTAKLVVMVGANGSGKTSVMEAMNHYYKYLGYFNIGDYKYLSKTGNIHQYEHMEWQHHASEMVDINFYDASFSTNRTRRSEIKGHFYFRSAYRNEPDFQILTMQKQQTPIEQIRLATLIQNDQTVSSNYQRIISNTISSIFDNENALKTVASLRDELIGQIRDAMGRVFEDLQFSSVGDPLVNGNFYFTKGITQNFSYQNLSAGEKAAFDLILDMVVQLKYYPNAIYCIDEPETHMHTKLQGKVLRELYLLVPEQSQLWLSTHSIGMLQEAEEIEKAQPGTVAFLDFSNRDFDTDQVIHPAKIGKAAIGKFYELAFGDFAKLVLPRVIIFCEGNPNGGERRDFDKSIYTTIFENTHSEAFFLSGGSCNDIENIEKTYGEIISTLLKNTKVIKIIDRDDRSTNEVAMLARKGIKVLKKRNLESYLFDNSVIEKLCQSVGKHEAFDECIKAMDAAIANSVERGNAKDDYKSASGEIYNALKKRLQLTKCGNNKDAFIRDTLARLITPDMNIYKQLEMEIFGESEER